MVEPADAKELIDAAIERSEALQRKEEAAERLAEKRFRDRVSLLVGVFAALLAVLHLLAAGHARESILRNIEASDDFAYMQAKIIRETVLKTGAMAAKIAPVERDAMLAEAARLRNPDKAGHGIGQLQAAGEAARAASVRAGAIGERYEWGETALQVAIVMLSIAMIARSRRIVFGAIGVASVGLVIALATGLGASGAGAH